MAVNSASGGLLAETYLEAHSVQLLSKTDDLTESGEPTEDEVERLRGQLGISFFVRLSFPITGVPIKKLVSFEQILRFTRLWLSHSLLRYMGMRM